MKAIFFWLSLLPFTVSCAQKKDVPQSQQYTVGKFSDDYYATIVKSTTLDPVYRGTEGIDGEKVTEPFGYDIRIFRKGKKAPILVQRNSALSEYDFEVEDENGKVMPNVKELPYGHQSVLMYEDVNFDGRPDLALKDGNMSCYGGPSFTIYLSTALGGFSESEGFTALAHDFCGMFSVGPETKQIDTMTKSGCCWHQFNLYEVRNNEPWLIRSSEVGTYRDEYIYQQIRVFPKENLKVKRSSEHDVMPISVKSEYYFDKRQEDVEQPFFSFRLKNNPDKIAFLYINSFDELNYTLVNTRQLDAPINDYEVLGKVEFDASLAAYGKLPYNHQKNQTGEDVQVVPRFKRISLNRVSLDNDGVIYTFIDEPKRFGIRVEQAGKTHFIRGRLKTRKGSLKQVIKLWKQKTSQN